MKTSLKKVWPLFIFMIILLINTSSIYASQLNIEDTGFGSDVQNRTLIGKASVFKEGSAVYFFTTIKGGENGDNINHVWIHEDIVKVQVPLSIGGPSWRTWSKKNLFPGSVGKWRVEARNSQGEIIDASNFECVRPDAP